MSLCTVEEVEMTKKPDEVIRGEWWQLGEEAGRGDEKMRICWEGEHPGRLRESENNRRSEYSLANSNTKQERGINNNEEYNPN